MLRQILGVSLCSLALAASAGAQANLTANRTLPMGGVSYTSFTVTTAGVFDIFTTSSTGSSGSTPFDPVIYLFASSTASGSSIASDDDSCPASQCGSAAFFSNSLINDIMLGVGTYTVAVGGFGFSEESAISGVNEGNGYSGNFQLHVASLAELSPNGGTGVAKIDGVSTVVPEPSTYALLSAGLAGIGAIARRRTRRVESQA